MTRTAHPRLTHAPLSFALCQVRFSTLRSMGSHIAAIQDRLRRDGQYRLDESGQVQEVLIGPQGPVANSAQRWEFLTLERTRSVVITEQFAVFQTTAYTVFPDFLTELLRLMDAIAATGQDILITRIGIRYVDAIVPAARKIWQDYLIPGLRGETDAEVFIEEPLMAYHQMGRTAHGRLVARITQNRDGLSLPLELAQGPQNLKITRSVPKGAVVTLIDIDHFAEGLQQDYDRDWLEDLAWKLKDDIYRAFTSYVTPEAMEEWA